MERELETAAVVSKHILDQTDANICSQLFSGLGNDAWENIFSFID